MRPVSQFIAAITHPKTFLTQSDQELVLQFYTSWGVVHLKIATSNQHLRDRDRHLQPCLRVLVTLTRIAVFFNVCDNRLP